MYHQRCNFWLFVTLNIDDNESSAIFYNFFIFVKPCRILNICFVSKHCFSINQLTQPSDLQIANYLISFIRSSEVPMFLQTGHFDRHLYYGTCLGDGFRTSFEMIHLKRPPHQCNHVQGMIETLHSKLVSTFLIDNIYFILIGIPYTVFHKF